MPYLLKPLMRNPTRREIIRATRHELDLVADKIEALSEFQWDSESLCAGWTIGEVANHLLYADRFPLSIGWGGTARLTLDSVRKTSPTAVEKWQAKMALRGPKDTAARLRSSGLPFSNRFPGTFAPRGNFFEKMIHTEDILRPLNLVHDKPLDSNVVWATLRTWARVQYRKLKLKRRLSFVAPTDDAFTLAPRMLLARIEDGLNEPEAIVNGEPLEMLMFVAGRPSGVEISGDGKFADALRASELSI